MEVWVVKFEEDLPVDKEFYSYRAGMLADAVCTAGHHVVRWASDFNHKSYKHRYGKRTHVQVNAQYDIEIIAAPFGYSCSHSIWRFIMIYWQSFALLFAFLRSQRQPDAIIVSMPAPITCAIVALFARLKNIPFFIDGRDMWPDILLDEVKGIKRALMYPAYWLMKLELRYAVRRAHGLIGITDPLVTFLSHFRNGQLASRDKSFPIGFKEQLFQYDKEEEMQFWRIAGLRFSEDEKIIYFAGTLNKTVFSEAPKIANAMRILLTQKSDLKLVMCGRGKFEGAIRDVFSGLDNVIFPGHLSAKRLAYLKSMSYIALLSIECRKDYLSSLSNKFFDYASGGLPIVTNLMGTTRHTLKKFDAGVFYQNADELADVLQILEHDVDIYSRKSRNIRNMFETQFRAEDIYKDFVKHIEENIK